MIAFHTQMIVDKKSKKNNIHLEHYML